MAENLCMGMVKEGVHFCMEGKSSCKSNVGGNTHAKYKVPVTLPITDMFGMGAAIVMLIWSLDKGKHATTVHFSTMQR